MSGAGGEASGSAIIAFDESISTLVRMRRGALRRALTMQARSRGTLLLRVPHKPIAELRDVTMGSTYARLYSSV